METAATQYPIVDSEYCCKDPWCPNTFSVFLLSQYIMHWTLDALDVLLLQFALNVSFVQCALHVVTFCESEYMYVYIFS